MLAEGVSCGETTAVVRADEPGRIRLSESLQLQAAAWAGERDQCQQSRVVKAFRCVVGVGARRRGEKTGVWCGDQVRMMLRVGPAVESCNGDVLDNLRCRDFQFSNATNTANTHSQSVRMRSQFQSNYERRGWGEDSELKNVKCFARSAALDRMFAETILHLSAVLPGTSRPTISVLSLHNFSSTPSLR